MQRGTDGETWPIIQYWHSGDVPDDVAQLIDTFRGANPELRHLLFCRPEAEELIAEYFGERQVAAFRACAVPAMQADYFRYCAVFALGGIYADADYRCMQALTPLIEETDGGLLFGRLGLGSFINAFFCFTQPKHPLLRLAVDVATSNVERRSMRNVNVATGPWVFTGLSAIRRLGSFEAAWDLMTERHGGKSSPYHEDVRQLLVSMVEEVGDADRIVDAFGDVRTESIKKLMPEWVDTPETRLEYKRGETHWSTWQRRERPIFC
jgi:hypothetical protein